VNLLRGKSILSVSIREFTPKTRRVTPIEKKKEFRNRMLAKIDNIHAIQELSRGKLLSIAVCFYLYSGSAEEGRAKKDLDNLLKIVLDTLTDHLDRRHTEEGLGLIEEDGDHLIFEVNATKKLVSDPKEEGIDLEIFEWVE
jgi:Holliday junction resolvase RusA-like endonuclease